MKWFAVLLIVSLMTAAPAWSADEMLCLQYNDKTIYNGTVTKEVYPSETVWILKLPQPMCFEQNKAKPKQDVAEDNVTELQLVFKGKDSKELASILEKHPSALVGGTAFHQFNGHHHRKILINVEDISARGDNQ